jgi:hypothetical protein
MLNGEKGLYPCASYLIKELRETQRWLKLIQRVPLNVTRRKRLRCASELDIRFSFDVGRSMLDVYLFLCLV